MKQQFKRGFRSEFVWILAIAFFTALSSEIKLSPFSGEDFRFGLGSITIFLMLLIRVPKNYFFTAIITTSVIIGFRVFLQVVFSDISIVDSFEENYPGGLYYFLYIIGFKFFKLNEYVERPLLLGIYATILEIVSNSLEHLLRIYIIPSTQADYRDWLLLIIVAIFRSFFAVGLYSSVSLKEQRKRLEEQLKVGSDLYIETLYLQKSMNHIEQVMADSYDLYRILKKDNNIELSKKALFIAQEIHEVKKDSQRIYAGLSDLTSIEKETSYMLSEVLAMSIEGNRKYAKHLKKEISFIQTSTTDFVVSEKMLLMVIINNIIANAIESIYSSGRIRVEVSEVNGVVRFAVTDSGKGISEEDLAIVFEAGFTTKYSDKGVAATGIGLSHVQEANILLEGKLSVESKLGIGTVFMIDIPRERIEQRGVL